MNRFRLNALRATNENAPTAHNGWGAETVTKRLLGAVRKGDRAISFSHKPSADARRAVPMSSNHPDARRADALRRRLLAVASVCASSGVALPTRAELAWLTGASLRQIHRHIPALRDVGAITTQRRAGRLYVQEARP